MNRASGICERISDGLTSMSFGVLKREEREIDREKNLKK